jgi:hypothetical protein
MSNRTKVRAHASARAAQKTKALESLATYHRGVINAQQELLRRWIAMFGNYCTTADSGQLYKDTMEVV